MLSARIAEYVEILGALWPLILLKDGFTDEIHPEQLHDWSP